MPDTSDKTATHLPGRVLGIAIPGPLRDLFDYLPARQPPRHGWQVGLRVRVEFGRRQLVGVIAELRSDSAFPIEKLKPVSEVIDEAPLPADWLWICQFTARYYQHSLGDTFAQAMPSLLRQGRALEARTRERWSLTDKGRITEPASLGRATRQIALLELLAQHRHGLVHSAITAQGFTRQQLETLRGRGFIESREEPVTGAPPEQASKGVLAEPSLALNDEQGRALSRLHEGLSRFSPTLLEGVTGSGKTEVYLQLIEAVLDRGGQALVLVPEIGLTPQTLERFRRRFRVPQVMLHSGVSDGERLDGFEAARSGRARIVIGTRSAIFTPMAKLGVIIVDEEHDGSFKQQDGLRYHARDLALVRGKQEGIPVVLGSATPSLESLRHAREGRFTHLHLHQRAGRSQPARLHPIDLRGRMTLGGLSTQSLDAIEKRLAQGDQVLVFINRRGFAPTLTCHACGWIAECDNCDARMALHRHPPQLTCHHCERTRPLPDACPACGSGDVRPQGAGTERTEELLSEKFPDVPVLRIDRDSTQRKDAMSEALAVIRRGEPCLLVGTQMLAKGHHFPHVTLVVVVNADSGLYAADFRALEQSAQLLVQVAGRAGRAERPGEVLIQTRHPEDPNLLTLIQAGYPQLAGELLEERRIAQLPPFSYLALLRAEATDQQQVEQWLLKVGSALRQHIDSADLKVDCLGPVPAPMERRQNRYHAQLLLRAAKRGPLHEAAAWLVTLCEQDRDARRLRWSLDVDPIGMA
ncbi:primosomal protein N' [Cobetia marina]|nr:primosomal protein N' [Cobetia marina]GED41655.1 primosomal protein N' [Cobetia marina]